MILKVLAKLTDFTTIMVWKVFKLSGFMNTELKVSKTCVDLVTKFEGYRPIPYICPAGYLTVGIGVRIKSKEDFLKKYPHGIPFSDAQKQLMAHMEKSVEPVIKLNVKVQLTQNQFDALADFIYNLGEGAFKESTLLKLLNQNKYQEASEQFKRWNKAKVNGHLVALAGLTRRRMADHLLFEDKEWRTV